jgi:hypothetical protein
MFGAISLQKSAPLLGLFTKRFTSKIIATANKVSFQFHSYSIFCNYCYHVIIVAARTSKQAFISYCCLFLVITLKHLGYV